MINLKSQIKRLFLGSAFESILMRLFFVKMSDAQSKSFEFQGRKLPYFVHSYNNIKAWGFSERSIEIPIIKAKLEGSQASHILEIGNVSQHYYEEFKHFERTVVDKFEVGLNVINEDIRKFEPSQKFDFVFSISTFEHMDSDADRNPDYYPPTDERFSSVAFENIESVVTNVLNEGGKLIVTVPIGYGNCEIDQSIFNDELKYFDCKTKATALQRVNGLEWIEVDLEKLRGFKQDPGPVQAICVLEFLKISD